MKLRTITLLAVVFLTGFFIINGIINKESDEQIKEMLKAQIARAFTNFKVKYHKTYATPEEEEYRYSIFSDNYVEIYRHNKFLVFSKVGVNQFADLSDREFKTTLTGYTPSFGDSDGETHKALPTDDLPDHVDWREQGAVTSVKIQNGCGGCWAFSTVGSIESLHFLVTGQLVDLSTQQVIDCCRIDEYGCTGGDPAPAFDCIRKFGGIMTEKDYPYVAKQNTCKFAHSDPLFEIKGFVDVPSDQAQVKAALVERPLSICLNSSDVSFKYYTNGVITECEDGPFDDADHCLLMVGYGHDDELQVDYWLIRNQWGTGWGEDGYVRIIRDDNDHEGPGKCFVVSEVRYPIV